MSVADLRAADSEFKRRAIALGKDGRVSKTHRVVRDELKKRTSKEDARGAAAQASTQREGETPHESLLAARREARAKYPQGHPERLKAERAVRHSRKVRRTEGLPPKQREAILEPRQRRSRRAPTPTGPTSSTNTSSIMQRQEEANALSAERRRTYMAARNQGASHDRAMEIARKRPSPPSDSAAGLKQRKVESITTQLVQQGYSRDRARTLAEQYVYNGKPLPKRRTM